MSHFFFRIFFSFLCQLSYQRSIACLDLGDRTCISTLDFNFQFHAKMFLLFLSLSNCYGYLVYWLYFDRIIKMFRLIRITPSLLLPCFFVQRLNMDKHLIWWQIKHNILNIILEICFGQSDITQANGIYLWCGNVKRLVVVVFFFLLYLCVLLLIIVSFKTFDNFQNMLCFECTQLSCRWETHGIKMHRNFLK